MAARHGEGLRQFLVCKNQKTLKNLRRRRENTRKYDVFSGSAVATVQNREKTGAKRMATFRRGAEEARNLVILLIKSWQDMGEASSQVPHPLYASAGRRHVFRSCFLRFCTVATALPLKSSCFLVFSPRRLRFFSVFSVFLHTKHGPRLPAWVVAI